MYGSHVCCLTPYMVFQGDAVVTDNRHMFDSRLASTAHMLATKVTVKALLQQPLPNPHLPRC